MSNTPDETVAKSAKVKKPEPPRDQAVPTRHYAAIGGHDIAYPVTTGTLMLGEEAEKKGDFATPYFASRYTFDRPELDDRLSGSISMAYYKAGQVMYNHQPPLVHLKTDPASFIAGALHAAPA